MYRDIFSCHILGGERKVGRDAAGIAGGGQECYLQNKRQSSTTKTRSKMSVVLRVIVTLGKHSVQNSLQILRNI